MAALTFFSCLSKVQAQAEQGYIECGFGETGLHYGACSWLELAAGQEPGQYAVTAPGGENGRQVHVCRDLKGVPDKRVGAHCYIPRYGKEYSHDRYQVLTARPGTLRWQVIGSRANRGLTLPGKLLVKSITDGSYNAYICAVADARGNVITGKYVGSYCWYSYGGDEYAADPGNDKDNRQVYLLWYQPPPWL